MCVCIFSDLFIYLLKQCQQLNKLSSIFIFCFGFFLFSRSLLRKRHLESAVGETWKMQVFIQINKNHFLQRLLCTP